MRTRIDSKIGDDEKPPQMPPALQRQGMSINDDRLLTEALAEVEAAYVKRKAEFMAAMEIDEVTYKLGAQAHIDYMAVIGGIRPFARSPLASESFIAGYVMALRARSESLGKSLEDWCKKNYGM